MPASEQNLSLYIISRYYRCLWAGSLSMRGMDDLITAWYADIKLGDAVKKQL